MKKFLAILLSLVMVASMLVLPAIADGEEPQGGQQNDHQDEQHDFYLMLKDDHTRYYNLSIVPGNELQFKLFDGDNEIVETNNNPAEFTKIVMEVDGFDPEHEKTSDYLIFYYRDGYYFLFAFKPFGLRLKYANREININSQPMAFYAPDNSQIFTEYYTFKQNTIDDENYTILNDTVYLNAIDDESIESVSIYPIDPNNTWLSLVQVEGTNSWTVTVDGAKITEDECIDINYRVDYTDGQWRDYQVSLNVVNMFPGLRFYDDERGWTYQAEHKAPGEGFNDYIVWVNENGEIDCDTNGKPIRIDTAEYIISDPNCIEFAEWGTNITGWPENNAESVTIYRNTQNSDEPQGSPVSIYVELPEYGFYKADSATPENFISTSEWVVDENEESRTVYFLPNPDKNYKITDCEFDNNKHAYIEWYQSESGYRFELRHENDAAQENVRFWFDDENGNRRDYNVNLADTTITLTFCDVNNNHGWRDDGSRRSNLDIKANPGSFGESEAAYSVVLIYQSRDDNYRELGIDNVYVECKDGEEPIIDLRYEGNGGRDEGRFHWIDIVPLRTGTTYIVYEEDGYTHKLPVTVRENTVVNVSSTTAMPGETVKVTLSTKGEIEYSSLMLEIEYDSAVMTLTGIDNEIVIEVEDEDEQEAALEEANNQFVYNVNTRRLIWVASADDDETHTTDTLTGTIPTLTFIIKDKDYLEELTFKDGNTFGYGHEAFVRVQQYRNDDWEGYYSFVADENNNTTDLAVSFENGNIKILDHKPGDFYKDGNVDMMDVVYMLRYYAGYEDGNLIDTNALDTNGNDRCDMFDVVWLLRYVAGWTGIKLH